MAKLDELDQALERLVKTALRVKEERDALYLALKELVRCVCGGDETAGVSMDDALLDADAAIAKAEL
jgi:hypothetical protein